VVGRFAETKLDLVAAIRNTHPAIVVTGKLRGSS
jgi:hypothetical protein